jgi:tripeptide aminopeptidase
LAAFTSPLAQSLAADVLERFVRYARIDTQSQRERTRCPSTPGQLRLAGLLVEELVQAGLLDASCDENGSPTSTLVPTLRRRTCSRWCTRAGMGVRSSYRARAPFWIRR